jgi:hypothetical protein
MEDGGEVQEDSTWYAKYVYVHEINVLTIKSGRRTDLNK